MPVIREIISGACLGSVQHLPRNVIWRGKSRMHSLQLYTENHWSKNISEVFGETKYHYPETFSKRMERRTDDLKTTVILGCFALKTIP